MFDNVLLAGQTGITRRFAVRSFPAEKRSGPVAYPAYPSLSSLSCWCLLLAKELVSLCCWLFSRQPASAPVRLIAVRLPTAFKCCARRKPPRIRVPNVNFDPLQLESVTTMSEQWCINNKKIFLKHQHNEHTANTLSNRTDGTYERPK